MTKIALVHYFNFVAHAAEMAVQEDIYCAVVPVGGHVL